MNKTLVAVCGAVALLSSAASAAPTGPMAECQRGADAWKDAYNKHDAAALAKMYDARTGMYSSDFWTAAGHDALLTGFKQEFAAGATMTSITCVHSARRGNILVSDGTWAATGKAPDGKEVSMTGHWVVTSTPGKNGGILTHLANQQMQPPGPK
jgi:ketosteroid isomerase-like protein